MPAAKKKPAKKSPKKRHLSPRATKSLPPESRNKGEAAVLDFMSRKTGDSKPETFTIEQLAGEVFHNKPTKAAANSKARNALRRPVRVGCVKKTGRGTYRLVPKKLGDGPVKANVRIRAEQNRLEDKEDKEDKAKIVTPSSLGLLITKLQSIQKASPENAPLLSHPEQLKTAIVTLAAAIASGSDSRVAKMTGFSRGFIIPRIKRLRAARPGYLNNLQGDPSPATLWGAYRVAMGLSDLETLRPEPLHPAPVEPPAP